MYSIPHTHLNTPMQSFKFFWPNSLTCTYTDRMTVS